MVSVLRASAKIAPIREERADIIPGVMIDGVRRAEMEGSLAWRNRELSAWAVSPSSSAILIAVPASQSWGGSGGEYV